MKNVLKDAKKSIRINSEDLEAIENAAKELNMTFTDYIVKLHRERERNLKLEVIEQRLEKVEAKLNVA